MKSPAQILLAFILINLTSLNYFGQNRLKNTGFEKKNMAGVFWEMNKTENKGKAHIIPLSVSGLKGKLFF